MSNSSTKKKILILGGGFGGVYAAMHLESRLGRMGDYEIALVNQDNYFVFQPMLPEVVSGSIGLLDTVSPLRRLLHKTRLYIRNVEEVDVQAKTVTLAPGFKPRPLVLNYDHLVVAMGNVTDFRGLPGLHEHAFPFKNLADAQRLRNHIIHVLAEADIETDPEVRKQLLTFVIAGGGFSGVEVAAQINDFVRDTVCDFHDIDRSEIRVILVHSGEWILDKELVPSLGQYSQRLLQKRGMEIRLKSRIAAASYDWAILKSGERIPTRTLVSTVPSSPNPVVESMALPKDRGRIKVTSQLSVEGFEDVWAIGDCALIPAAKGDGFCPPTAQFAVREGIVVAKNIVASIRGGKRSTFHFGGLGKMGALGHRRAVAEMFGGIRLSGILAWFCWRAIYWAKMPGADRKLRVAVDWFLDLLIPPELVQMRLDDPSAMKHEHFEPGENVICQGDVSKYLYILVKGSADVFLQGENGEERLGGLKQGEFFGDTALMKNTPYPVTVRCVEPMDVITLPKDEFRQLVETLPGLRSNIGQLLDQKLAELTPEQRSRLKMPDKH